MKAIEELDRITAGLESGAFVLYKVRNAPIGIKQGKGKEIKRTGIEMFEIMYKELK